MASQWAHLYRAVDQHGQVIDVLLSVRRDLAAARRFFARAIHVGTVPVEADHGRLKAQLRPMRGVKRHPSARILATGHALVQNLRRGHSDIATGTVVTMTEGYDIWWPPEAHHR